uniref:MARVEL domain-containing protein n=1 Tax=Steinernema glaseri TaxID=37863 RepID=A0A1I8AVK0_9BILA
MFFSDAEDYGNRRQTEYFPENRCFCALVHVRTGTIIIGLVSAILAGGGFVLYIVTQPSAVAWVTLAYDVYIAVACACLLLGIYKNSASLLVPYIIGQFLLMVHMGVAIVALVVAEIGTELFIDHFYPDDKSGAHRKESEVFRCFFAVAIVILSCSLVVVYYLYTVVRNCYLYLRSRSTERIRLYSYSAMA